jgi:hypothetical protein
MIAIIFVIGMYACDCIFSLCSILHIFHSHNVCIYWFTKEYVVLVTLYLNQSRWPCGLRHKSAVAHMLGSRVRIPPASWIFVSDECCVLCRWGSLRQTDISLRRVLPSVCVCMCVCVCVWVWVSEWVSECVSLGAITCNNHPLHLWWGGRNGRTKRKHYCICTVHILYNR